MHSAHSIKWVFSAAFSGCPLTIYLEQRRTNLFLFMSGHLVPRPLVLLGRPPSRGLELLMPVPPRAVPFNPHNLARSVLPMPPVDEPLNHVIEHRRQEDAE